MKIYSKVLTHRYFLQYSSMTIHQRFPRVSINVNSSDDLRNSPTKPPVVVKTKRHYRKKGTKKSILPLFPFYLSDRKHSGKSQRAKRRLPYDTESEPKLKLIKTSLTSESDSALSSEYSVIDDTTPVSSSFTNEVMAAIADNLLKRRAFCLITGASRGLGRCIAEKFSGKFAEGSRVLLVARSTNDLQDVKSAIEKLSPDIRVAARSLDLSNPDFDIFKTSIASALEELNAEARNFEAAIIVHNAGSLGDISKKSLEVENVEEMRKYFDLNVNSVMALNTAFFKVFPIGECKSHLVINISSLAAVQPFKTWVYYCTGKAARDMMFKVMAAEYPTIRVISYSPGPLKTDMTIRAREESGDAEIRQWFIDSYANNKMLTVEFTVKRLLSILELNKFKSGDHVDVFDGDSETVHSRPA